MSADAARARVAASDDLTEDGQIRIYTEVFLCTACTDAESRDDFVDDEQRTVSVGQFLDASDEFFGNRPGAALRSNWFQIDCCCAAVQFMSLQFLLQIVQIAREELICMAEYIAWDSSGLDAFGSRNPDPLCQ